MIHLEPAAKGKVSSTNPVFILWNTEPVLREEYFLEVKKLGFELGEQGTDAVSPGGGKHVPPRFHPKGDKVSTGRWERRDRAVLLNLDAGPQRGPWPPALG